MQNILKVCGSLKLNSILTKKIDLQLLLCADISVHLTRLVSILQTFSLNQAKLPSVVVER